MLKAHVCANVYSINVADYLNVAEGEKIGVSADNSVVGGRNSGMGKADAAQY